MHQTPHTSQQTPHTSQQTPHTSPSRASYGMAIVRILEKIDRVITAPHCIYNMINPL